MHYGKAIFVTLIAALTLAESADDFLILEASGEISAAKDVRDRVIAQVYTKRIGAESFQIRTRS